MSLFSVLYTQFLWRPLFNGLVASYTVFPIHDLGIAIILLTFLIRLVLAPFMFKAQHTQRQLANLQPEVKKIQEEHRDDRHAQGKAMMRLYAEHRVNPVWGIATLIVQIPILITLFNVFRQGLNPSYFSYLYSFVPHPQTLSTIGFGIFDLSRGGIQGLFFGVVAAATQFFYTKLTLVTPTTSTKKGDFASMMAFQTKYLFPLLVLGWSYTLPSALTLYWTVLNIFGIIQELIVHKFISKRS